MNRTEEIIRQRREDIKNYVLKYMNEPKSSERSSYSNGILSKLLDLFYLEAFGDYPGFGDENNFILIYREENQTAFFNVYYDNENNDKHFEWTFLTINLANEVTVTLKVHGEDEVL